MNTKHKELLADMLRAESCEQDVNLIQHDSKLQIRFMTKEGKLYEVGFVKLSCAHQKEHRPIMELVEMIKRAYIETEVQLFNVRNKKYDFATNQE